MDTKSKSNHKKRKAVTIIGIFVITLIAMCFFPLINQATGKRIELMQENAELNQELDNDLLLEFYKGSYVLYMESMQRGGAKTAADVFLHVVGSDGDLDEAVNSTINIISDNFEGYRSEIDYCIRNADGTFEKNTSQPLDRLFSGAEKETQDELKEHYNVYFKLQFDANGLLTVEPLYSGNVDTDSFIKAMGQMMREYNIWEDVQIFEEDYDMDFTLTGPTDIDIIYAIPKSSNYQLISNDYENGVGYGEIINLYAEEGGQFLYFAVLVILVGFAFVMTSSRIWKCDIDLHRPGKWYLFEAACIGIISGFCLETTFLEMLYESQNVMKHHQATQIGGIMDTGMDLFVIGLELYCIFGIWYLSVRFIRPLFALGIREYIKEYSIFYQIFPWIKRQWNKFKDEVEHTDFGQKSIQTIIKVIAINFIVLAICSTFWFFGIFMLLIYSVVLFFIIQKYYKKVQIYYQRLLWGVNRMAEGDLETEITEDVGMFEPVKEELSKVRTGFKKAVDEEVKSQRMKTELITNVSHDLKTPLTAITTYVELLKKDDITEEERRSYIEILERKALRLKVLVEDLFEVSKATSNNITLNLVDVDVTNLMKQVSIEHADKYEELGIELRWSVPEEKTLVTLDSQKTYRVFENLFVNIQKYAMPHSRVYIAIEKEEGQTKITMKNMSAVELNVRPEELTERFVRGDASRNTEGSGLGLAIAKSFVEAQGGIFKVEVDGDLFKSIIVFKS